MIAIVTHVADTSFLRIAPCQPYTHRQLTDEQLVEGRFLI